jgi:hypothetical protein
MWRPDKIWKCFLPSLALLLGLLPACAYRDYWPPDLGTSVDLQSILAKSLEGNLREIPFDPAGKRVDLRVSAWGTFQNAVGLEGYVRSLFREWIVSRGGVVGPGQFQMAVFLPVLGTTAVGRDLSYQYTPIYYSERFRATARMVVVIKDAGGKTLEVWHKDEGVDSADIFLMRIFGPFDIPTEK